MLFFDTYAIIEIVRGNPAYRAYENEPMRTSLLNLGELHYNLLKELNPYLADEWFERLKPFIVEFDAEIMRNAMIFKFAHRKRKLSTPDCVGYGLATGDRQFQDLPNVEFVPKEQNKTI